MSDWSSDVCSSDLLSMRLLTLRKIYGLSQRQIAQQLDISENTVETQVANGMRRCAAFLARHGLP